MISQYRLCTIPKAAGILSNYRKLIKKGRNVRKPYCWKPVLTSCYRVRISNSTLHLLGKIQMYLSINTHCESCHSPAWWYILPRSTLTTWAFPSLNRRTMWNVLECLGLTGTSIMLLLQIQMAILLCMTWSERMMWRRNAEKQGATTSVTMYKYARHSMASMAWFRKTA